MLFYRQLGPIRAMSFDLDDTLYDNHPVIERLEQQVTQWLHQQHPLTASQPNAWWVSLKRQIAVQDPWLRHDVTQWRFEQIRQGLLQLGYSASLAQQVAEETIHEVLRLRNLVDVPPMTHQVLSSLAEKLPLIAITNGNVDVEQIGLSEYFQSVLKAGPDGRAKPYADLFEKASHRLALPARMILHVGDHLVTDVQGAKQNGFQSCWYNDQGLTLRENSRTTVLPDVEIHRLEQLNQLIS